MRARWMKPLAVVAGVWFGAAGLAVADAVFTADGSKLVGRIQRFSGGTVVIETTIAGTVTIDASQITAIAVDDELNVEFESGDRLVGTIDVAADQSASTMHSALGELTVTPTQIKAIWPVGGESPDVVAARDEAEALVESVRPKWNLKLEAGGTFTEGNTDTFDARGRFDLSRKTDTDRLNFFLGAKYHEQNKARDTNEYRGGINYETDLNERWYWYTRLELEFDEFEDLDLRATASTGVGYFWLKKPEHELKTRVGLGYRHESYVGGRTDNQAVIDFGMDYRLDISPWLQFTHSNTYSPDFEDTNNYRLDFDTAMLIPLEDERFSLKFGVSHEYNSRPQPGFERLDTTYYANLVMKLKDMTK